MGVRGGDGLQAFPQTSKLTVHHRHLRPAEDQLRIALVDLACRGTGQERASALLSPLIGFGEVHGALKRAMCFMPGREEQEACDAGAACRQRDGRWEDGEVRAAAHVSRASSVPMCTAAEAQEQRKHHRLKEAPTNAGAQQLARFQQLAPVLNPKVLGAVLRPEQLVSSLHGTGAV